MAHVEPESTNFPEGGDLHNLLDLVVKIRSNGFTGKIILKEHPLMKYFGLNGVSTRSSIARSINLFETLGNLGVIFVNEEYEVPDNQIALTLSGTVAIERSLLGKRTIIVGYPWFRDIPGAIMLDHFLNKKIQYANDKAIEIQSKEYLKSTLSFKTLDNIFNIGTGSPELEAKNNLKPESIREWQILFNLLEE
jgi:hypothetical protein